MAEYPYQPDLDEDLAISRAVKDYLRELFVPGVCKAVYEGWAKPEQQVEYPALVVKCGTGSYESTTPRPDQASRMPDFGKGVILYRDCEYVTELMIELHATDRVMRSRLTRILRESLQGTDETYGCHIPVPDYFGGYCKVKLEPMGVSREDVSRDAHTRHFVARMTVAARLPVMRLAGATDLLPRFGLVVQEAPLE